MSKSSVWSLTSLRRIQRVLPGTFAELSCYSSLFGKIFPIVKFNAAVSVLCPFRRKAASSFSRVTTTFPTCKLAMPSLNRRFYTAEPIHPNSILILDGAEHQHLAKVLRLKVGDAVTLFDGTGCEYDGTIQTIARSSTEITLGAAQQVDRELPFHLTLAVALPKGDRQQWLVEKAVELGVSELIPLETEFGVAQPSEKARERMARHVIAASKQCGRNRLLQLPQPASLQQVLTTQSKDTSIWLAHPGTPSLASKIPSSREGSPERQLLLIGPEGGFSDTEIELADAHSCEIVSLGPRILRIETAAVAFASALIYAYAA